MKRLRELSIDPIFNNVAKSTDVERYDRRPTRHCFGSCLAEGLLTGRDDHDVCGRVEQP
jgi:hypothetical protein